MYSEPFSEASGRKKNRARGFALSLAGSCTFMVSTSATAVQELQEPQAWERSPNNHVAKGSS
jgi:hypothetical protein